MGFLLAGCQDGLDVSGNNVEGYESFGSEGGVMQTPEGGLEVEIAAGALVSEVEVTVGRVDDCLAGAVAGWEIEPVGLPVRGGIDVTIDLLDLVDPAAGVDALLVYVQGPTGWEVAARAPAEAETISVSLNVLGRVAVVPEA